MNEDKHNLDLTLYASFFLDVLGQSKSLEKMDEHFKVSEIDHESVLESIRETFFKIVKFRRNIEDIATNTIATELKFDGVYKKQFSDMVIYAAPIGLANNTLTIKGVLWLCQLASVAMFQGWMEKYAIRGAIGAGICGFLPKIEGEKVFDSDELYGGAISRAYAIESKLADYPRVIVDKSLVNSLNAIAFNPKANTKFKISEQEKAIAEYCLKECICEDFDGQYIIDYLKYPYNVSVTDDLKQTALSNYVFIVNEYEKFKADGNDKLAERYLKVKNYMDLRIKDWK